MSAVAFAHEEPATGALVFGWDEALVVAGIAAAVVVTALILRRKVKAKAVKRAARRKKRAK